MRGIFVFSRRLGGEISDKEIKSLVGLGSKILPVKVDNSPHKNLVRIEVIDKEKIKDFEFFHLVQLFRQAGACLGLRLVHLVK